MIFSMCGPGLLGSSASGPFLSWAKADSVTVKERGQHQCAEADHSEAPLVGDAALVSFLSGSAKSQ